MNQQGIKTTVVKSDRIYMIFTGFEIRKWRVIVAFLLSMGYEYTPGSEVILTKRLPCGGLLRVSYSDSTGEDSNVMTISRPLAAPVGPINYV